MKKPYLLTAALSLAMALALSGCSGSNGNSSGSPSPSDTSSSPIASASSPASPSAEPSASAPSDSPSPAPSSPAPTDVSGSQPAKPPAVSLGTVTALRLIDDKSGWTGGQGWIARTDDGGAHWTAQYDAGKSTVKQIFALNGDKVWATLGTSDGGDKSLKLIRSTDGGKHWSSVGTIPNAGFLHFTSETTAFSGNAMTTDGGKTWTKLQVPSNVIGDVYFHDSANGWALQSGNGEYRFLHSSDKGKTWTTVMKRASESPPTASVIRSTGKSDAWIEVVGGSGMSQTSYALFHTTDGGKTWLPSLVHNTAGAGPAPGFEDGKDDYPDGPGSKPGDLYVVNPQIAYMGGYCPACDNPNTVQITSNGGKSWTAGKQEFTGFLGQYLAATDAKHVWLITSDSEQPSALYVSADGGKSWTKKHTFDKPAAHT